MITIREHQFQKGIELSPEDEQVLNVYGQLTSDGEPYSNEDLYLHWKEEFNTDTNRCYVLRNSDGVVAVANYDSQSAENTSNLEVVVVDEAKRKKFGYGSLLMDFLAEQTSRDGNSALTLNADENTVDYYSQKHGFEVTEMKNPHDIRMTKRV